MITYLPATTDQYAIFLQMMWDDGQEYLPEAMRMMQLTWEEYSKVFRSLGQVCAIYQDKVMAGFYWIEERGDTLHLHALILKTKYQGQGIGTAVLKVLAESYSGKLEKIELGVYQANSGAIRLYQKHGFQITRNLGNLHFFIMQKTLNPQAMA